MNQLERERDAAVACAPKGGEEIDISDKYQQLADNIANTRNDLENLSRELHLDFASRINVVDEAEDFLYNEMQAVRDLNQTMQDEVKALQAKVARLSEERVTGPT